MPMPRESAFAAKALESACPVLGAALLTPEEPEHAWLALGRPRVLRAEVALKTDATSSCQAVTEGLVSLLPLIFEKLLGKPLDAAPWAVPVISTERKAQALEVAVAIGHHAPSPVASQRGLFEVETPIGVVSIRLLGLRDTREPQAEPDDLWVAEYSEEDQRPVVLISLPNEWFEASLLRRAWDRKALRYHPSDDDAAGLAPWHGWLSQWGEIQQLLLSTHIAGEAETSSSVLAVSFLELNAGRRCAEALGGQRLLCRKEPIPRAIFAAVQTMTWTRYDEQAEAAWQEHLLLEQEISRIDRGLVLEELRDAVPEGVEACLEPLVQLLERWLRTGTLHATSTVCAQRRQHEAETSSHNKSPELFRRACWHSAFRVVLQIRSNREEPETLALALTDHWRKAHGICLDVDEVDIRMFASALQEVWKISGQTQDELRRCAESEALNAEKALMEELEAEEEEKAKGGKKKTKNKKEKTKRPRERLDSKASSQDGGPSAASDCSSSRQVPAAAPRPAAPPPVQPKKQQRPKKSQVSAPVDAAATSPPVRRSADLDSILAAVRKSEELHKPAASAVKEPSRSKASGGKLDEDIGSISEAGNVEEDTSTSVPSSGCGCSPSLSPSPSEGEGHSEDSSEAASCQEQPECTTTFAAAEAASEAKDVSGLGATGGSDVIPASNKSRSVVTWGDLGGSLFMVQQKEQQEAAKEAATPAQQEQQQQSSQLSEPPLLCDIPTDLLMPPQMALQPPLQYPPPSHQRLAQSLPVQPPLHYPPPPHIDFEPNCHFQQQQQLPQQPPQQQQPFLLPQCNPPAYSPVTPTGCSGFLSPPPPPAAPPVLVEALALPDAALRSRAELDEPPSPLPEDAAEAASPSACSSPAKNQKRACRRRRKKDANAEDDDAFENNATSQSLADGPPPSTPAAAACGSSGQATGRRSVVTLSDLGLDLGAPAAAQSPSALFPAVETPTATASMMVMESCLTGASGTAWPGQSPTSWQQTTRWPGSPACASPIMGTCPVQGTRPWGNAASPGEASTRSLAVTSPASAAGSNADHGESLRSWLQASGLPASGADLAEKLRSAAPEAYED